MYTDGTPGNPRNARTVQIVNLLRDLIAMIQCQYQMMETLGERLAHVEVGQRQPHIEASNPSQDVIIPKQVFRGTMTPQCQNEAQPRPS